MTFHAKIKGKITLYCIENTTNIWLCYCAQQVIVVVHCWAPSCCDLDLKISAFLCTESANPWKPLTRSIRNSCPFTRIIQKLVPICQNFPNMSQARKRPEVKQQGETKFDFLFRKETRNLYWNRIWSDQMEAFSSNYVFFDRGKKTNSPKKNPTFSFSFFASFFGQIKN